MYYINKVVGWVLSPFGILFAGLGVAWLLNRKGWRRTARWCAGATLALLWVLGCGVTTRLIGVPLERLSGSDACQLDMEKIPEADAIVLLGGGMGAHRECGGSEMFNGADRAWVAAKLWNAGKAKILYCTGGGVENSTIPLLADFGVDRSAIRFSEEPRNTEEESKFIKAMLIGEKSPAANHEPPATAPKVLLVTSAWHMPRARMMFERRGFEVVPCPADFEMSYAAEEDLKFGDFFPTADGLFHNSAALKEWVGLAGYSILRR